MLTWACEMPSQPSVPTWVTSTETTILIEWQAPLDDGGCPVREYRVFMSDVPSQPVAPTIDFEFTDATRIKVDLEEPYSGGSVLTNYEVQMDEGLG